MAENKNMEMFEDLVNKLDAVGDDELAIQKVFEEAMGATEMSEELNETELENVAGGLREYDVLKWLLDNTNVGKLTWTGLKVSARGIYDYCKYGDPYRTYSREYVKELNSQFDQLFSKLPKWMR